MNEAAGQGPASGFDPAAAGDGVTAGQLLRQAREAAGLHVESLAMALKVPVRKLDALEADRYEQLSDLVFVRALAASVCRNLRIDPAPILQRLPATGAPRLASTEGSINAPFRSPRDDGTRPRWRDQLSRPVLLAVFALLLGALVLILLPAPLDDTTAGADGVVPLASVPAGTEVPAASQSRAAAAVAPAALAAAAPAALAAPLVPVMPVTRATQSPSASPATASAGKTAAPVPVPVGAPTADGIVVFTVKAASWIQVTDAKGAVALRKLLAAGESASASGVLPLAVTVGSASATAVQVRGKPLDLAPLTRDNVARFEVK